MENRILVPLDGTESAEEILCYVRSITPKPDTSITLLCVLRKPGDDCSPHAQRINDELAADGWSVSNESRMGDPVEEIVKFIILWSATLVMMSTHGRSGLERIREGSVTEQVLRQSPCPVFILHTLRTEPADHRTSELFERIHGATRHAGRAPALDAEAAGSTTTTPTTTVEPTAYVDQRFTRPPPIRHRPWRKSPAWP